MLTVLAPLVFTLAFCLALGTILYMVSLYEDRAIAALRREHVPAATICKVQIAYTPAREARGSVTVRSMRGALHLARYAA